MENMKHDKRDYKLRGVVVGISAVIFSIIFVMGIVNPELFTGVLWGIVNKMCDSLGWLVNLGVLFSIFLCLFFLCHPFGKIKLGGPDAKPEFSRFTWWAISLCAGMGMGIVMFPPAEVIEYAMRPASGMFLEAGSPQAIQWGFEMGMMHWTITLYGVYVAAGLVCAYVYYNLKQPYSTTSTLYPLLGNKVYKYSSIIDGLIVFAIVGGVAGSLGYGLLQVSDGLRQIFGVVTGAKTWIITAIVVTIIYTISSVTGLKNGIQWLGNKNALLFISLLGFVIIVGPTVFSLNLGTQATGGMIEHFFTNMTFADPYPGSDKWSQWWNWLWYIDFFIFAPTTGLFLARLSKGRSIREFITVNMVAPCIFGWVWFMIFGGLAAHTQWVTKSVDLFQVILDKGHESIMLALFDQLPLAVITKPLMLIIVLISFITLANAVTSTVSKMSITTGKNYTEDDAPAGVQIFWGIFMGAIAVIFLLNGGLDGAKVVKLLVGFPILILQIAVGIGFLKMFIKKETPEKIGSDGHVIYDDKIPTQGKKLVENAAK